MTLKVIFVDVTHILIFVIVMTRTKFAEWMKEYDIGFIIKFSDVHMMLKCF